MEDVTDPVSVLVRRFYDELWNHWDDAAVSSVLAPSFAFRGSLGNRCHGLEEWRAYRDAVRRGSGDFHNEVVVLVASGSSAAARLRYTGTHSGILNGWPATGRSFSYDGAAFFEARDSRLVSAWVLGDLASLAGQLAPGRPGSPG